MSSSNEEHESFRKVVQAKIDAACAAPITGITSLSGGVDNTFIQIMVSKDGESEILAFTPEALVRLAQVIRHWEDFNKHDARLEAKADLKRVKHIVKYREKNGLIHTFEVAALSIGEASFVAWLRLGNGPHILSISVL